MQKMNIRYSDCHDEQYNDDSGNNDNDKNNVEDGDVFFSIVIFWYLILLLTRAILYLLSSIKPKVSLYLSGHWL